MNPIALIIPGIMYLGKFIFGAIEPSAADLIATELSKLSMGSGFVANVIKTFESRLGNIDDERKQQFTLELNSMLGQIDINKIEAQQQSYFFSGWRPFLAWGLSIIIVLHGAIFEIANILRMMGLNIPTIQPMETMVLTLMGGLLGLYMGGRTLEKVTGVNK